MSDDLFAEQTTMLQPSRTKRITCCACGLPAEVPAEAPNLCELCKGDLDRTDELIAGRHHAALWAAQDAWERLDADVAHADDTTRARWEAFQKAVSDGDPRADATERMVAAGGISGDLAALIRRWLAWKTALDVMGEAEKWSRVARAEVRAARPWLETTR
jgi:hypothetical protein